MRSPEWSRQIYPREVLRVWKIRKSSRIRLMNCLSHSSWIIFQLVGNIIPDTRKHYPQHLGIMFSVPGTVLYFADFSIGQLSSVGLMSSICSWTAPRLKTLSSMV